MQKQNAMWGKKRLRVTRFLPASPPYAVERDILSDWWCDCNGLFYFLYMGCRGGCSNCTGSLPGVQRALLFGLSSLAAGGEHYLQLVTPLLESL